MKTYNRYLVSLAFISLLSLVLSLIAADGYFAYMYLATYVICFAVCHFCGKEYWTQTLMRIQIYVLVPSIVSFSALNYYFMATHVLGYLSFILVNLICAIELTKRGKYFVKNHELKEYAGYGAIIFLAICMIGFFFVRLAPLFLLANSLFLYLLTLSLVSEPNKKVFPRYDPEILVKIKIAGVFVLVIAQFFLQDHHFLRVVLAVIYTVLATDICFYYRAKLYYLLTAFGVLSLLHFIPYKDFGNFDLTFIALLALAFHIRNNKLYEIQTEFGKLTIKYDYKSNNVILYNNDILHGEQYYTPVGTPPSNFWYYGNSNKEGPIFEIFNSTDEKNVALVGLGLGAISSYGRADQNYTFYELNPEVKNIATNSEYFSFLANCKANLNYVIGDARQTLEKARDGEYGIILVDAYSGKYVPKCFLTTDAMNLYFRKLNENGIVLIHITTGEKGIESLLGKVTKELGLTSYITFVDEYYRGADHEFSNKGLIVYRSKPGGIFSQLYRLFQEKILQKKPRGSSRCLSQWVIIAKNPQAIPAVVKNCNWHLMRIQEDQELYTDEKIEYNQLKRGVIV